MIKKGYKLNDRVVQPAAVKVAVLKKNEVAVEESPADPAGEPKEEQ